MSAKKLDQFEKKVLKLAEIDKTLIDTFIINQGYSGIQLLEQEKAKYENAQLIEFEQKVLSLAGIDQSLVDSFIVNHGYAAETIQTTAEKTEKSINRLFHAVKDSRKKGLVFTLAELAIETGNEPDLSDLSGTDLINYYFFKLAMQGKLNANSWRLNLILEKVNKILPHYSSPGHFNYLQSVARRKGYIKG